MGACRGALVMCVDFNDEILIPKGEVGDFAVIACDQFTACPEYWEKLGSQMPDGSALDVILPECYLDDADDRINKIKSAARSMIENGRFNAVRGAVAVTRTTKYGRTRRGIVASVDLRDYDYRPDRNALIRASERTIEERIPPRVKIRQAIGLEFPHILLLVDDRENALMRAVDRAKKTLLYDGDLRGDGGHIKGELVQAERELSDAVRSVTEASRQKFGVELFALVGDGNHSLATAKYCAEHHATPFNGKALVEIVNVYDEGLVFEPIHRIVKTDDPEMFVQSFAAAVKGDAETIVYAPDPRTVSVPSDKIEAIKVVDAFCEDYVKRFGGSVDYVHGNDAVKADGCVGIKMRGIDKSELFDCVLKNGALPKKTFSLGEAEEKRFYVEGRKIK